MTDNEIVKALECCVIGYCRDCAFDVEHFNCKNNLMNNALDLLSRQKAEIERYKGVIKILESDVKAARMEAAREFGHLLIDKSKNGIIYAMDIPDYVKEMEGE